MKEWTQKHRREALRRTYEIAAVRAGDGESARGLTEAADHFASGEALWRLHLEAAGLDSDAALREVRRVRALAEGRLVRETGGRLSDSTAFLTPETARAACRTVRTIENRKDVRLVRVTRIRRRSP